MADPTRYRATDVRELWSQYHPLMDGTRKAATDARKMLAGKSPIVLPETVRLAGSDAWVSDLPHKYMAPQRTRQKLIAKRWEVKRPVTAGGPRAASVATRIAQPLNAIMRHEDAGFPWEDVNDLLLVEGLAFSTVSLDMADWRKPFSLYGPDGKTIESRYAIDQEGRFRGDDGYDEDSVDVEAARKDMEAERNDHLARKLPFRQRAWSIRSVAPMWGSDLKLEGLIIESHWSAHQLRRKGVYVGKNQDGSDAQLYPLGAVGEGDEEHGASGKRVTVTEAWCLDDDGNPYLSYCVEGYDYAFKRTGSRDLEDYTIDLSKLCQDERGRWHGFSRLPVTWGFGLGWSPSDMDERAMGFIRPFLQSWRNIDSIFTSLIIFSQMMSYPPLIEKVPFGSVGGTGDDDAGMDDDEPSAPDIQPGKITRVTGDIIQLNASGPPPAVMNAISIMMGETKAESEAGGSGSAGSGIQLSLAEAFNEDALTTVHESALKIASQNASLILEASKLLGECYEPIRVYEIADVLLEQKDPSETSRMLTLDPGLIGTSYDVKAVNVKVPGENPAVRQQNAALVKEGFYDKRWFLEQDGYPAPEEMQMRVAWQEFLDSEEGKAVTGRMLSQYVESKFLKQIQEAIAAGQANPQGLAVGFGDGVTPPPEMIQAGPQATGGMGGMDVPNPAAASLAGAISGGMQQGPLGAIAQAGGAMPTAPVNTAGV